MTTAERVGLRIQFDNSYARLPERFAVRLSPTPVTAPQLVRMNEPLARKLGIDPSELATQQGVEILAGNRLAAGSEPLAMAYAGHQFGGFVPQLGDGRAILLGEVIDCDGNRRDIQLKGSGPTPFSRQATAALRSVRCCVNTSSVKPWRPLASRRRAALPWSRQVRRYLARPHSGGRADPRRNQPYPRRHFPILRGARGHRWCTHARGLRHRAPLSRGHHRRSALRRAPRCGDRSAGGVGCSVDDGWLYPWRDEYRQLLDRRRDHRLWTVRVHGHLSSRHGIQLHRSTRPICLRQSAKNCAMELARLAETLVPILSFSDQKSMELAQASIATFGEKFQTACTIGLRKKLGLVEERSGDLELAHDLLGRMAANAADFTLTFHYLAESAVNVAADDTVRRLFKYPLAFDSWAVKWRERLSVEGGTRPSGARPCAA